MDLMELLPARGKSKPLSQDVGGHIAVVQAAELASTRKIVPDLGTWLQRFVLYAAAILQARPERAAELMAYQYTVVTSDIYSSMPQDCPR